MREMRIRPGGILSVLMVLVILMLSSFAALAWIAADGEEKMALRAETAAVDYYAADRRCEELLFEAAGLVSSQREDAITALAALEGASVESDGGEITLTLVVPVDDTRQIRAVVQVDPASEQPLEGVTRAVETTVQWEEEILDIWDGN